MRITFPMVLSNDEVSTTSDVWNILVASRDGDMERIREFVAKTPGLVYAQYSYTPPIHFAVREGHLDLVQYLLSQGARDPSYITYPFKDTLLTIARDRQHVEIAE